jgi:hypothetical protein
MSVSTPVDSARQQINLERWSPQRSSIGPLADIAISIDCCRRPRAGEPQDFGRLDKALKGEHGISDSLFRTVIAVAVIDFARRTDGSDRGGRPGLREQSAYLDREQVRGYGPERTRNGKEHDLPLVR